MYNNNLECENIFSIKETIFDSESSENIIDNSFYEKQFIQNFDKKKENNMDDKVSLTIEKKSKCIFNLEKSGNKYSYCKRKTLLLPKDEIIRRKLRKNAESAKKARDRKKIFYDNILKENIKLKKELEEYKNINLIIKNILCDKCKKDIYNYSLFCLTEKNDTSNHIKMLIFSLLTISVIIICLLYNF
jgi:hypothetical protein